MGRIHALVNQVLTGRILFWNSTGRGDMIRGYTASKQKERPGAGYVCMRDRYIGKVIKVRRVFNIS